MQTDNSNFTPDDITSGEMWACEYRTTRMLGEDGAPVRNQQPGETARGPGEVDSVGVIVTRDRRNRRLEVVDVYDQTRHVVSYDNVWAIEPAEVIED